MFNLPVRALLHHGLFQAGAGILSLLALLALAAPILTSAHVLRDPIHQDPAGLDDDGLPRPAGGAFLLGTDHVGRDVFSRVLHGARVSLAVGVGAMLTATVIGVGIGLIAGFYGGKLDTGL